VSVNENVYCFFNYLLGVPHVYAALCRHWLCKITRINGVLLKNGYLYINVISRSICSKVQVTNSFWILIETSCATLTDY
jgi:hypothetical protein